MPSLEACLRDQHERFLTTAIEAFRDWAPNAHAIEATPMRAGFSGAAVLNVDISTSAENELPSGHYILKLSDYPEWDDQLDEATAHENAIEFAKDYATRRIPKLQRTYMPDKQVLSSYAMLYEIAGSSLDRYRGTDASEDDGFLRSATTLTRELLEHWCSDEPSKSLDAGALLKEWLGYRIDPSTKSRVQELIDEVYGPTNYRVLASEAVANPMRFLECCDQEINRQFRVFEGQLHGDLHGGNVLVDRWSPTPDNYWLIDLGLAVPGPIGFDQAYMEVAQVMYSFKDHNETQLVQILKLLDEPDSSRTLPPGGRWFMECIKSMRDTAEAWIVERQPRRQDDLRRQFVLARIAAGLNWANKPMDDHLRKLALTYASWATAFYLKRYEPKAALRLESSAGASTQTESASVQEGFTELWDAAQGFASDKANYVLIAEGLGASEDLRALGQLPWSLVIDLDPYSDEAGLHSVASPVLEERRGVHQFGKDIFPVDMTRGTAWMMASGWKLKRETATDFTTWKRERRKHIRQVFAKLVEQTSPQPIHVLILPGATPDRNRPMERLSRTVEACWEQANDQAKFILVGSEPLTEDVDLLHLPITTDECVRCFVQNLGVSAPRSEITIPGQVDDQDVARPLATDALRIMEENFEVLHSGILDSQANEGATDEVFWRGRPPTWFDIHSGTDISRPITNEIIEDLHKRLDDHRNTTTVLNHNPGAGGTTAALRAAWELHWDYPTAVLHTYSEALPDRLQSLYSKSGKPVLLVADSAILTESPREDLYRELSKRNLRVTLLYLRRVFRGTPDSSKGLSLIDPMDTEEAEVFQQRFARLTESNNRKRELERITNDPELERYRSPFFYGLVTFERDFQGTENYVTHHLSGVRGKARDVLEYLAMLTIYSNSGLNEVLIKRMIGVSDQAKLSLSELLGEQVARLVTTIRGNCRIMHQVIAEEILATLSGDARKNWKLNLFSLAKDFVIELASVSDPHSERIRLMLRQLFTERQGDSVDDVEDRQKFSPLIEDIDQIDRTLGNQVLEHLAKHFPSEAHFFNHLGRHQIYRLERELDKAVGYLEHAVKLSDERDFIHWHTLGLAYRSLLRKGLYDRSLSAGERLLERIGDSFEQAADCFTSARNLNAENLYGYITHIQMIVQVAKELVKRAGVASFAELTGEDATWVREQMNVAAELAIEAEQLYGTLDKSDKLLHQCIKDLHYLHGNIDEAIVYLTGVIDKGDGGAADRRSLAHAFFDRADRKWSNMQLAELSNIRQLIELNLRSSSRREEDYRLWFEAYKLLPEFQIDEALSQLALWTERFPSWRAHYYMAALHFNLWFERRSDDTLRLEDELELCQKLFVGRKNASHLWFAHRPTTCPLQSASELGKWDRKTNFWTHTENLRRVNGFIESIKGAQAGTIKIDGELEVFFVPGRKFNRNEHESKRVNFYLGFSAGGLRAWGVELGHVEEGNRPLTSQPATPELFRPLPRTEFSEASRQERLKSIRTQRVIDYARDFVTAKTNLGATVDIIDLERQVEAIFGVDGLFDEIDVSLSVLLSGIEGLTLEEDSESIQISSTVTPTGRSSSGPRVIGTVTHFEDNLGLIKDRNETTYQFTKLNLVGRNSIEVGSLVDFYQVESELGPTAAGIKPIGQARSLEVIQGCVDEMFSSEEGDQLSFSAFVDRLEDSLPQFRKTIARMGFAKVHEIIRKLVRVEVVGQKPDLKVRYVDEPFGRLKPEKETPTSDKKARSATESDTPIETLRGVVKFVHPENHFGFIAVDGDKTEYHFSMNGWPNDDVAARRGVSVEFRPRNTVKGSQATDLRLLETRHPGVVLFFQAEGGFGTIRSHEDDKKYKFHIDRQRHVTADDLTKGVEVEFTPGMAKKLPVANDIELVEHAKESQSKDADPFDHAIEESDDWTDVQRQAIQRLRQILIEHGPLKASALGSKLATHLKGEGKLADRLGVKAFLQFVDECGGFDIEPDADDPVVTLVRQPIATPAKPQVVASARQNEDEIDAAEVELIDPQQAASTVQQILTKEGEITVADLGARFNAALPGKGKLAQRLQFPKFVDFLKQIPAIRLERQSIDTILASWTTKSQPPESAPNLQATDDSDAPVTTEEIRQNASEIVRRVLSENGTTRIVTVASVVTQEISGEGKLGPRLGFKKFSDFLKTLPWIEFTKSESGESAIRLQHSDAMSTNKTKVPSTAKSEVDSAYSTARQQLDEVRILAKAPETDPKGERFLSAVDRAIQALETYIDLEAHSSTPNSPAKPLTSRATLSLAQLYQKIRNWEAAWSIARELVEANVEANTQQKAAGIALRAGEQLLRRGSPVLKTKEYATLCEHVDSLFPDSQIAELALAALKRADRLNAERRASQQAPARSLSASEERPHQG